MGSTDPKGEGGNEVLQERDGAPQRYPLEGFEDLLHGSARRLYNNRIMHTVHTFTEELDLPEDAQREGSVLRRWVMLARTLCAARPALPHPETGKWVPNPNDVRRFAGLFNRYVSLGIAERGVLSSEMMFRVHEPPSPAEFFRLPDDVMDPTTGMIVPAIFMYLRYFTRVEEKDLDANYYLAEGTYLPRTFTQWTLGATEVWPVPQHAGGVFSEEMVRNGDVWLHYKGDQYTTVGVAEESTNGKRGRAVIYRNNRDQLRMRDTIEFRDGRFRPYRAL